MTSPVTDAAPLVAYIASIVGVGANGTLTDDHRAALLAHCERKIEVHRAIRITCAARGASASDDSVAKTSNALLSVAVTNSPHNIGYGP